MKSQHYILGVDLGTGGVKAVLFDPDLNLVAKSFIPCETFYPQSGWAEQNPDDWWTGLRLAVAEILSTSKIKAGDIAVIGIDSMTPVLVPVDAAGNAIRPALIWMDRRATKACQFIDRQIRNDLFKISGNHNDPSNFGPKAMWFRDNEPEAYKRTAVLHHANGYLISKLTGINTVDKTQCGLSQLCDTKTSEWSDTLITGCRLDKKKLPEIFESTEIVGAVTAQAAKEIGLEENTPIIAGSMDNVAAGLGLGIHKNGELYLSGGTATNVCLCVDQPLFNPAFHIYSHIIPNTWLSVAGVDFGGAGLRWFKEILGNSSFAELDEIVANSRGDLTKPLIFLPYMVGQRAPIWNDHTRGVLFGLHPSMGRGELSRTLMEGNAMGVKRILGLFEDLGHRISSAKLTGGAAESAVYSQIFSDVIGHPLEIVGEKDVATLGVAMAAAYGIKMYSNFDEMTAKVRTMKTIEPSEKTLAYYRDLQELFIDLYEKLEPEFERLAKIKNKHASASVS